MPPPSTTAPDPTEAQRDPWGFLVLDKAAGLTSHDCVARVRRRYGLKRVGHGGTLDPAVTGVLPIALGPATRLLPYLEGTKTYRGVIQLGVRTSSDDLSGEELERRPVPLLEEAALEAALGSFRGPILQRPPQVSAVHVAGERAHVRVRRGESLELEPRPVTIERLELLAWHGETGQLEVEVRCSAGTYIRSLARDLGNGLGCGGALAHLRRTKALGFDLSRAVTLERLAQDPLPELVDPREALAHLPCHHLDAAELESWRCGRALAAPLELAQRLAQGPEQNQPVVVLDADGELQGLARGGEGGRLQPKLVLNAKG